jgi:microcystin-dependent protein
MMSEHIKIAARSPRKRYRADGVQRVFAFDFAVFRPEDIEIGIDGSVLSGGYTVAIGSAGSGAVTLDAAPPDGAAVVVQRRLLLRRETDFQEGGELRAKTLNDELDFQTAALQQVATAVARSLHLPDEDPDDAATRLPRAELRARKALVFDDAGNPAVSADMYADQAARAADSAAAAAAGAASAEASADAASVSAWNASSFAGNAAVHLADTAAHAAAAGIAAAEAQAGAADAAASASAVAIAWTHAAAVAMEDPGAGAFRFDAASPAAAGAIAVSTVSSDMGNPDVSDFVATWGDSTNPGVKGTLTLRKRGVPSTFAVFAVGSVADNGTWLGISLAHVASAGSWTAGDVACFGFARAGDKGLDGAGTIVSIAPGDASIAVGGTPADRTVALAANGVTLAKLAREGAPGQVLMSNGPGGDPSYQPLPAGVPAGTVVPFAGTAEPAGWLFAAGQAVSRSAFAALFAAIGTTFGGGDGTTTFNLPDLRGRVAAGRDNMNGTAAGRLTAGGAGIAGTTLGAAGGSEIHTLTVAQMPVHAHSQSGVVGGQNYALGSTYPDGPYTIGGSTGTAGGGQPHPNAQPTLVLNFIVKT